MRKIILFLLLFALNSAYGYDYSYYCSSESAPKTLGGKLSSISGVNFLTRNIAESKIESALKKETGSKFKVKINGFFGSNALNGAFKSFSAKSKNYRYKNFYASNLNLETICPFNKVSFKNDKLFFDENFVLKYSTEITQQDLDKTLLEGNFQKTIDEMNSNKLISSLFKIQNSKVTINDNRLVLKYEVLPFAKYDLSHFFSKSPKPVDIVFGANLKVENNKLQLCDFDFNSIKTSSQIFLPIINLLNPLNYKLDLDEKNKGELKIENVKIADSKIKIDGFVLILKNN